MAPEKVGLFGIAKPSNSRHPFAVVNELICERIGRFIGLPIPPGCIVTKGQIPYFVSLNFNLSGEDLPPIIPSKVIAEQSYLSWGVIVFDAWMVNCDRHNNNISYDTYTQQLHVFDHSHALLCGSNPFETMEVREQKIFNIHCLAKHVLNQNGLSDWINRVQMVPDYVIKDTVNDAGTYCTSASTISQCVDYLLKRRDNIESIIETHKSTFPNLIPSLTNELE